MSDLNRDFEQPDRNRRFNPLNLLTVLMVVLAGLMIACVATVYLVPDILPPVFLPRQPALLNTAAPPPRVAGTMAPTASIAEVEVPDTWTPSTTPRPTNTATPRGTPTWTLTPSLTSTFHPTKTPTPTPTPTRTPTETNTPGPSPTPSKTRSAYPFTVDAFSPLYTQNFANNAGCNWLGVAGQVFDLEGRPVGTAAYVVQLAVGNLNLQTYTGGAIAYGPSGWELAFDDHPKVAPFRVQLFTPTGTPVSEVYEFATRSSCNQNLVLVNFVQNH